MSEHDGAASLVRSDALLVCPFCGEVPRFYENKTYRRVRCENRSCGIFRKGMQYRTWNTRHTNSPICATRRNQKAKS